MESQDIGRVPESGVTSTSTVDADNPSAVSSSDAAAVPQEGEAAPASPSDQPSTSPDATSAGAPPAAGDSIAGGSGDVGEKVRMDAELSELGHLIRSTPVLNFLKPRLARLVGEGLDFQQLLGFYRIISQMFKEELDRKSDMLKHMEEDHQKLRDKLEILRLEFAHRPPALNAPPVVSLKSDPHADELLEKKDKELREAEARLDGMKEDFQNYRNRAKLDTEISIGRARDEWLRKILGIGDNFDRALAVSAETASAESILTGVRMIQGQLVEILVGEGVTEIPTKGHPFDPKFHEALVRVETNDYPEDTVVEELQKGYLLGPRVLRAAMVKVAKPAPQAPAPPAERTEPRVAAEDDSTGAATRPAATEPAASGEPKAEAAPSAEGAAEK